MWSKTYQCKYITLKEMHEQNMLLSSSTLQPWSQQYDVDWNDLTSIYESVHTHRVHLNDSDGHNRHKGFSPDWRVETCVWCKGKTPSRWSWIPLSAYTPTFVWRSSPTSITELGHIYQSHVLNSKRFWKRLRIKGDQTDNCWWRHLYEKRWKWAWTNYISTVMFYNSIFVLEQKKECLVKSAVGHQCHCITAP